MANENGNGTPARTFADSVRNRVVERDAAQGAPAAPAQPDWLTQMVPLMACIATITGGYWRELVAAGVPEYQAHVLVRDFNRAVLVKMGFDSRPDTAE